MAKFAAFDFSGLSSAAREAVNKSSFTRGKKGPDGVYSVVVKIAGSTIGPFHGLQEAADETKKWAKKKFPGKAATDSIDAIAAKYGHEVKQNDAGSNSDFDKIIDQITLPAGKYASITGKIEEINKGLKELERLKKERDVYLKKIKSISAKLDPAMKKRLATFLKQTVRFAPEI